MLCRAGIALFVAFASASVSPALSQSKNPKLKVVTRGTVSTTAVEWPDIVARKKGFYEKEGLKVEQALISPTTITPSLIGGSIQIGFISASQLVIAVEAGADLVGVGKGADPSPYSLVTARSIETIADLKGKTLSLADPGDAYTEATREILRRAGLNPEKDINFRYGGNSNQRMAALIAGAVDAVPVVPPQDRLLLDQGFNSVAFYPDYFPNLALSVTAVTRAWAKSNSDALRAFMRAQAAAIAWLYDPVNKDEALSLLMEETKADLPAAIQSYDVYLTRLHIFPMNGCVETKGLEVLISMLSKINKTVKQGGAVSKYVDTQWCPK
jgi:ABC-type nitrate/sulfonate/bicarbonate transport system substrate-binding protein